MSNQLLTRLYQYFDKIGGYKRTKEEQELFLLLQAELKPATTETYFQPELYFDDGTCIEICLPDELNSWEVFHTKDDCIQWLEEHGYNPQDCIITEYYDEDIEEHTYIDII